MHVNNKSNAKKLRNKQHIELSNCIIKATCTFKGKFQNECIFYKVEVYSYKPSNVSSNDKKLYVGSTQGTFKKKFTIIGVV